MSPKPSAWLLAALFMFTLIPSSEGQNHETASLQSMLSDHRIWGRDWPYVASYLRGSRDSGETGIIVFADHMVGAAAYGRPEEAKLRIERLQQQLLKPLPGLKPAFATILSAVPGGPLKQMTASVQRLTEDATYHVVATIPEPEFLAPGLSIKKLESWYGRAESVTREVVQGGGERRPIVLTQHRYANGAISFVEWDLAAEPGAVNRVVLNVPAANEIVFQEAP